ncbi:MAG: hypothetical protein LBM97_00015 [Candidatus Nomurabacteria bacterium]|jgi:hypothetical protein|nr:hypothetical protein [Candidatus Nomurabacteria bacterium]
MKMVYNGIMEFRRNIKWLVCWGILFAGFVVLDSLKLGGMINYWMDHAASFAKYGGIILCLVFAMLRRGKDPLLAIAIGLTLLADTLLFWTLQVEAGVLVFIVAQIFHTIRFSKTRSKSLWSTAVIYTLIIAYFLYNKIPLIYASAIIYGCELLLNVYLSGRVGGLSFVGFLLFLACDVNVGLGYLAMHGIIPFGIATITQFLVFIFYLPSQVCIVFGRNEIDKTLIK